MVIHSLRGMLPKNKMRDSYLKNVKVYDGPGHDLHTIGLPQFSQVKPLNFEKMFGSDVDPSNANLLLTPDTKEETVKEYQAKGFSIEKDDEYYLRDFMKKDQWKADPHSSKKYMEKLKAERKKVWKKILMKNFKNI